MKDLEKLANALTNAEPAAVAELLAAASDVALVIGEGNVIDSVAVPGGLSSVLDMDRWLGRPFERIVTPDSRASADLLLRSARNGKGSVPQSIAHGADDGARIELRYAAAALGANRPIVLVGRALPSSLGADPADPFSRVFEFGTQPALVVDGRSGKVVEASPRAASCLGIPKSRLAGMDVFELLAAPWRREARARLRGVMASGRSDRFVAEAGETVDRYVIAMDRRPGTEKATLLVRFLPPQDESSAQPPASSLAELVASISDAVALLDAEGRIRWTNEAFLAAAGLTDPALVTGRRLDDFLAPIGGGDLARLLTKARQGDEPALTEVALAGEDERTRRGQLSIAWLPNAEPQGFGAVLSLPGASERLRDATSPDTAAIMELVGSVPLKELVRDTTDAVERMCIEAALRLTGDNRAAAARALGLSRQALYLKLERYGLGGNG